MSTEKLERDKRKRAILRTATTKLITKLETELKANDPVSDVIEETLALLLEKEASLSLLDSDIGDQISDEKQFEAELLVSEEYKENIIICKTRANRRLKNWRVTSRTETTPSEHSENLNVSSSENQTASVSARINVKLPRLTIEQFKGDVCGWPNFWAQYKTAIHENDCLSDVEKFNYLKSFLSGSASTSISGLPLTAENYLKAIKILEDRFGKKDVLIDAHMQRLLNLVPVRRSYHSAALRKLYDECEIQIRSLETLGVTSDSYGCLLCPILFKAIPDDLVLEFNRQQCGKEKTTVNELLTFIKIEVESRERTNIIAKNTEDTRGYRSGDDKNYVLKHKAEQTVRGAYERYPKPASAAAFNTIIETVCPFCGKAHKAHECTLNLTERKELLKKNGRCFICYKKGHISRNCRANIRCPICQKRHQKTLCEQGQNEVVNPPTPQEVVISSLVPETSENKCMDGYVYLQTVRAVVESPCAQVTARILLDGGSQLSFVSETLSRRLQLPVVGEETLTLHTFGATDVSSTKRRRVKLKLRDVMDKSKFIEIEALESPEICAAIIEIPNRELQRHIYTMGFQLSDTFDGENRESKKIDILIGSDVFWKICSGKVERLSPSIMLNETLFGWTVQGSFTNSFPCTTSIGMLNVIIWNKENEDQGTLTQLKAFWDLESLGITNDPTQRSVSDSEAIKGFNSTIKFKENRYEVRLPLKCEDFELPNNYKNARNRLESLVRRFQRNHALYDEYKAIVEEYISLGIVEELSDTEADAQSGNLVYYLPHHPVIRKDKQTTRIRMVFDASSHPPLSPSLNDILHPGPNLNPDLLDLLIKFRSKSIAVVADIEKAFLQISLSLEDRDAVRFLWIDGLPQEREFQLKPKTMRMTRVLFGVTSSPFLLGSVINHHLEKFEDIYPETCIILKNCMYVDDLLTGANDMEKAFGLSIEAKEILQGANMNLRKWQSNSSVLKERLKNKNFDVSTKPPTFQEHTIPFKVLGLIWDTESDAFKFDVSNLLEFVLGHEKTKRAVIKASGRIFDPIGFLSPFTVQIKMLFQSLWERCIQWDEELPEDIRTEWDRWCEQLPALSEVEIPRYYFDLQLEYPTEIQIHCFTDASEKAYGAVLYLRFVSKDNTIRTSFVTSKCRVAPLKRLSLPRLELMGALIGSRLVHRIKTIFESNAETIYLWTDSSIVLHWIQGSSHNWKPFVSNRVAEIRDLTSPENWKHCPGRENPADILTRGQSTSSLIGNSLWWYGPPWLRQQRKLWPQGNTSMKLKVEDLELRAQSTNTVQYNCLLQKNTTLINMENYSSISRIIRITAWIKRFIFNAKAAKKRRGTLSAEELQDSEAYWIKDIQYQQFGAEIQELKVGSNLEKESDIKNLCPYLDDSNLLRVGGRLRDSDLTTDEKHPIILPRNSKFTKLLIQREHELMMHGGVAATLSRIRNKFWIPAGRQLVKKVIYRCLVCKRYSVKPATQITAPLPKDRIQESKPFAVVGLDFCGPIFVKDGKNVNKAYVALFTCAVTRAVHLELVSDMTTQNFLLAFRRFVARRGLCNTIYSDNAKTFKRAEKELKEIISILRDQKVQDYIAKEGISWKYICERAAWWGGFYERIVRSVKTCLKKVLRKALLHFEELTTLLSEIEAVLNARPLTFTYSDAQEPCALTPAHFLTGSPSVLSPPINELIASSTSTELTKRNRYRLRLLRHLWLKWKTQYLLELRSAHFLSNVESQDQIRVNDVILLQGVTKSKFLWDLGLVTEVFFGRDGQIRSCAVRTANGTVLRRPVQLLYPLEMCNT